LFVRAEGVLRREKEFKIKRDVFNSFKSHLTRKRDIERVFTSLEKRTVEKSYLEGIREIRNVA